MREHSFRKYLSWFFAVAFWLTLTGGEILILIYTPIAAVQDHPQRPNQTANKEQPCGEIQTGISYLAARYHGCTALFKNLTFIDAYHDTINAFAALLVAIFTFTLWRSTDKLWRASKTQSEDMRDSIAEAARAATAMENVASGIQTSVVTSQTLLAQQRQFWAHQMRAYISVDVGAYCRQNTRRRLRFDFRPNLANAGLTPANDVLILSRLEIKDVAIPPDFNFSLQDAPRACPQLPDSQVTSRVIHGLSADSELTDASLRPSG